MKKENTEAWKECKLGEICDVRDGTHDSPKQSPTGFPLITSKNLKSGCIDLENTYLISESDFWDINKRSKVDKFDILYSMIGTVGEIAIVKSEPSFAIKNVGLFKCNGNYELAKWVYYFMQSSEAKEELQAAQKGSTQSYISLGDLRSFPILLPPLPEQRAIASVLSSLDDKIDLLHRQNKTLEAMAETLFRQWFVEEADEGWEEVPLSFYADNIRENVKVENLSDHEHYVGLEHIPRKRVILDSWGATDSIESNKSTFKKYDILFGKLRSYFHKVVYTPISGVCSTDILVIRAKKEHWLPFCLFWFFSKEVVEHSDLGSGGTRMPRTNWEIVSSYKVPCPPEELIIEFARIIRPSLKKMFQNINAIRTLESLRDTLLPKLMSGEVRVATSMEVESE